MFAFTLILVTHSVRVHTHVGTHVFSTCVLSWESPRFCDHVLTLQLLPVASEWKAFRSPASLVFPDAAEPSARQSAWSGHTGRISSPQCARYIHASVLRRSQNDLLSLIHLGKPCLRPGNPSLFSSFVCLAHQVKFAARSPGNLSFLWYNAHPPLHSDGQYTS